MWELYLSVSLGVSGIVAIHMKHRLGQNTFRAVDLIFTWCPLRPAKLPALPPNLHYVVHHGLFQHQQGAATMENLLPL